MNTSARTGSWLALAGLLLLAGPAVAAESFVIGLAANGTHIEARAAAQPAGSAPVVVLVGGLSGNDASVSTLVEALAAFEKGAGRPVHLLAIPLANPGGEAMQFPPTGIAYRENPAAHTLWRWLGALAPDLVLIAGDADHGLAAALGSQKVAGMGRIPARAWNAGSGWADALAATPKSEARLELEQRLARTPRQLATQLAQVYGRDFDQPWYIGALALVARIRLGETGEVRRLVEPWVDGSRNSLERPNALVMAGHVVFSELARTEDDPRYLALVRKVADLGFDASGQMLEAMPYHDGYSDSVFMGTTILAQAGSLTGERRYFDMADRHLRFMENLDLRPDGLYRHRPEADVAWGRGNGFAAIGLALTLPELPAGSAAHTHALQAYRNLMNTLLPLQTRDGLWRNVVNHPGAFAEFSGTAMIGFALQRGLDRGWIAGRQYQQAAYLAWQAVNARTSMDGAFIDVCESTARLTTLEQYLQRTAILGQDPRAGAMAMLFATERMR